MMHLFKKKIIHFLNTFSDKYLPLKNNEKRKTFAEFSETGVGWKIYKIQAKNSYTPWI